MRTAVLLASLIAVVLVFVDLARTSTSPLNLVQPGRQGPSVEVFVEDFPDSFIPDSTGLDGQQFYVVARNPFDLDQAADHLDRPRYRLQRPLLSWLAWLGHPTGGGVGLIASLFVVGVLSVALLAWSVGALCRTLGGAAWPAALVGLFPGVWWSLRVTVADTLATALALAAIALGSRSRTALAVVAGAAAVLAKETAILVLVGWLIADLRDRTRWWPTVAAGATAVAWAAFLRVQLPGDESIGELTAPLAGLIGAVRDRWIEGEELWGLLGFTSGLTAAIVALALRGIRHPLAPAIVVQLLFLSLASADVLGNDFGSGRAFLAALSLAVVAIATPGTSQVDPGSRRLTSPVQGGAGVEGPGISVSGGVVKR